MYQIDSRASSIKTMSVSNNMITSLDNDFSYSEDEEILENIKNNKFGDLYEVFELQVDKDFFKFQPMPRKCDSKKFIPTVKSIFAPLSKKLKNSKNSNSSLKSTYKVSNEINIIKKKSSIISKKSEKKEEIQKKENIEISDSLSISLNSSFTSFSQKLDNTSKIEIPKKSNFTKIRSLRVESKRNSCCLLIKNNLNKKKNDLSENRGSKHRSSSTQKKKSQRKEILDKTCYLCKKNFFPKNVLARILLCKHIFHKICLDKVFSKQKNYTISCPECFKIIFK